MEFYVVPSALYILLESDRFVHQILLQIRQNCCRNLHDIKFAFRQIRTEACDWIFQF